MLIEHSYKGMYRKYKGNFDDSVAVYVEKFLVIEQSSIHRNSAILLCLLSRVLGKDQYLHHPRMPISVLSDFR